MDNELYLIHVNDYLDHIDGKLAMYDLLLGLVRTLRTLLSNDETAQAVRALCSFEQQAHEMYEDWGIPDEYAETGTVECLSQFMEDELLPADGEYGEGEECEDAADLLLSGQLLKIVGMLSNGASRVLDLCGKVLEAEGAVLADMEPPENDCAG